MNLRYIYKAFVTEWHTIITSWYRLSLVFFIPLVSFVWIGMIFAQEVARELPIAVVDQDHTKLSRTVVNNLNANDTLHVEYKIDSLFEGKKLLQNSKVYGVVLIPKNFEKNVRLHHTPKVVFFVNMQYILTAKTLKSAVSEVMMHSAAGVEYVQELLYFKNFQKTHHEVQPVDIAVTPLFNETKNYFYFLVSALIPSMWQIFIVISIIVSFGEMFQKNKQKEIFKDGAVFSKILGILLPYTLIFMTWGVVFLSYIYLYSGWGMSGSVWILFLGMLATVIAYEVIALFLFSLSFDYARSLSLGAVVTAPAFAFLGVTFPADSMNSLAVFIRELLPISHYVELQISQVSYPHSFFFEIEKFAKILMVLPLMFFVYFRFKNRVKR